MDLSPTPLPALRHLVDETEAFLIDCDGVLWNAGSLIPGAAEALLALRLRGKRLFYVTNNSSKSRQTMVERLAAMGVPARQDEIYTSAWLAARIAAQRGVRKAYVMGGEGIVVELAARGIASAGGPDEPMEAVTQADFAALPVDPDIGAVIVGWDVRLSYGKLCRAALHLQVVPGCLFIATNRDAAILSGGRLMPGGGSMVAAVEAATGIRPLLAGKPGTEVVDCVVADHGLDRGRLCMIGDRMDTDMALAAAAGIASLLVLTGITSVADTPPPGVAPTAVAPSIAALA
ncbi:MAG: sugar-phosphatase [Myxococcales bacterium]